MSEALRVEEEVRSEVKRALVLGDIFKAEKLAFQHPEAFTQLERTQLLELAQRARTFVNDPEIQARIVEIARSLSS
ncbi:MAG: hypothetical protein QXD20_09800 [Ignisphaera sp.]